MIGVVRFCVFLVWLEIFARIVGPKDHGPYLIGLTAGEPETELERAGLYKALFPMPEDEWS